MLGNESNPEALTLESMVQGALRRRFKVIKDGEDIEGFNKCLVATWRKLVEQYGVSFKDKLAIAQLRFFELDPTKSVASLPYVDPTGKLYFPLFHPPEVNLLVVENPINDIFKDGDPFPLGRLCYEFQRLIYTFPDDGFLCSKFYDYFSSYFGTYTNLYNMVRNLGYIGADYKLYNKDLVNLLTEVINKAREFIPDFESLKIENTNIGFLDAINYLLKILGIYIPRKKLISNDEQKKIREALLNDVFERFVDEGIEAERVSNIQLDGISSSKLHIVLMDLFLRGEIILHTNKEGSKCIRYSRASYMECIRRRCRSTKELYSYFIDEIDTIKEFLTASGNDRILIEELILAIRYRCPRIDYSGNWGRILGMIANEQEEFTFSRIGFLNLGKPKHIPPLKSRWSTKVYPRVVETENQIVEICKGDWSSLSKDDLSKLFTNPDVALANFPRVKKLIDDLAHKSVTITQLGISSANPLPKIMDREFTNPVSYTKSKGVKGEIIVLTLPLINEMNRGTIDYEGILKYLIYFVDHFLSPKSHDTALLIANTCIKLAEAIIKESEMK